MKRDLHRWNTIRQWLLIASLFESVRHDSCICDRTNLYALCVQSVAAKCNCRQNMQYTHSCRSSHYTDLCNLTHSFAVCCCSVLQCVAVCCSVLQCVAVCCSVFIMQTYATRLIHLRQDLFVCDVYAGCTCKVWQFDSFICACVLQCVAVCCSVLQCVAVCCSVLQCVAVCGDFTHSYATGLVRMRHLCRV